jgi:hypothetical protein
MNYLYQITFFNPEVSFPDNQSIVGFKFLIVLFFVIYTNIYFIKKRDPIFSALVFIIVFYLGTFMYANTLSAVPMF